MSKALIISDENQLDKGFFESSEILDEFVKVRIVRGRSIESVSPADWDLIVHLGSDLSLASGLTTRSIEAEASLMTTAIQYGTPVLGICFGAQMMALVLGGRVVRMPRPEIGWSRVYATDTTGILEGDWFQWHYDSFTLPKGAEKLAENPHCIQGFRMGRSLATQFHPELDASVLSNWLESGGDEELGALGICSDDLSKQTKIQQDAAKHRFDDVIQWFLKLI